jgi:hypothetical protein
VGEERKTKWRRKDGARGHTHSLADLSVSPPKLCSNHEEDQRQRNKTCKLQDLPLHSMIWKAEITYAFTHAVSKLLLPSLAGLNKLYFVKMNLVNFVIEKQ